MRNTNLWSIIGCISLLLLSFGAQAQNLFVIEGKVKNVKQGVCLNLFQMEGSVGSSIAVDTLRGDSFRFEVPVSGTGTTLLSLLIRDGNLYSMGLSLWAKAGSHIRLTGEDMNIYTWQVESDVPQQKIWQLCERLTSVVEPSPNEFLGTKETYACLQKRGIQGGKSQDDGHA